MLTGQDICDRIRTNHLEHCPLSGLAQIGETKFLLMFVKTEDAETNTVVTQSIEISTDYPWWRNFGERKSHEQTGCGLRLAVVQD